MKKYLCMILALSLCLSLCACTISGSPEVGIRSEAADIAKAKEYIDSIYEYTNLLAALEVELRDCTDLSEQASVERKITEHETLLEFATSQLMKIYEGLSEAGREEVMDYVEEAGYHNIENIWAN